MGNIEGLPSPVNCSCASSNNEPVDVDLEVWELMYQSSSLIEAIGGGNFSKKVRFSSFNIDLPQHPLIEIKEKSNEVEEPDPRSTNVSQKLSASFSISVSTISSTLVPTMTSLSTDDCTCISSSSDPWMIHRSVSGITSAVVSCLIILSNLFVLGSILWSLCERHKRRSNTRFNRSYLFLFNLAFSDLFVGLASLVSFSLNQVVRDEDGHLFHRCLLEICFIITPCCASVYTMTMLSVDRYLTVMNPFNYKSLVTIRKALLIVLLVWIISFPLGFAPLMGWGVEREEYIENGRICSYLFVVQPSYVIFTLFGCFMPQLILIIYLYIQIFRVSKKHNIQISQFQVGKVEINRSKGSDYGMFPSHFNNQEFARSCPVTPVMSRTERKSDNYHLNGVKTLQTGRRKPFRTVSFGPASFNGNVLTRRSLSSCESIEMEVGIQMRRIVISDDQEDNVFENSLNLPGAVHSGKQLPEITRTNQETPAPSPKQTKMSSVHKLRRTVSYAGSAALNSIASQLSNRFGNLKKDAIKRNMKTIRTVTVVVGFFFLMWTPFLLVSAVQMICGSNCHLQNLVGTYLLLLGISNSAINPLVYTYTNRDLKKLMKDICCPKSKRTIITNHDPIGSCTLRNPSAAQSAEVVGVPNTSGVRTRRITSGSLASNVSGLYEPNPRLQRNSTISNPRISRPVFAKTQNEIVLKNERRLSSLQDGTSSNNYLSLPPNGRKKNIAQIEKSHSIKSCL